MPKDGYVCESFTRAVVSKVLTFNNINWALLAEEKWRGKVGNGEVVPYREAGEELTYKRIILNKFNFDVSVLDSDIDQVEDERKLASKRVEDIRNSPEALAAAKESRGIQDQKKKLKGKIAMEEIDRDHSRKMITYFTFEDPDEERASEFASKAANNEIRLQNLQKNIRRLDTLHREGNSRMLNALDAVGKLNKEMKELKVLCQVKMTSIKKLSSLTRRPKSFTSSPIVGDVADGDWDQIQIELKPCSLCGKCFPNFDVVMGSCGCFYHP